MEHLEYKITILASPKKVWNIMLKEDTYKQWVAKSWPNSFYEGKWEEGKNIKFIGPDGSGTLAELVEVKPYEKIVARHIAILNPGGIEDRTSDGAKNWIGITEQYDFFEHEGKTNLVVSIATKAEWREMFDEGWPGALEELKKITERQLEVA